MTRLQRPCSARWWASNTTCIPAASMESDAGPGRSRSRGCARADRALTARSAPKPGRAPSSVSRSHPGVCVARMRNGMGGGRAAQMTSCLLIELLLMVPDRVSGGARARLAGVVNRPTGPFNNTAAAPRLASVTLRPIGSFGGDRATPWDRRRRGFGSPAASDAPVERDLREAFNIEAARLPGVHGTGASTSGGVAFTRRDPPCLAASGVRWIRAHRDSPGTPSPLRPRSRAMHRRELVALWA